MKYLSSFLIATFILSIIFNYITLSSKSNAIQIVNKMGIGYNLGNSFECYIRSKKIKYPDEQITLLGNPIPTKILIKRLKKYGFKTIRFPITWINFIDEYGNINSGWMSRVKEVVDWIVENNMYCILNTYHDGGINNWLYKGLVVINKYINLWTQIANEFEDYDEYLIFESMNEPAFSYSELFNMTQAFIDTIRNSKGKNKERLLLISAPYAHLDYTIFSEFKLPKDPYDKLAVSIHYFIPELFTAYPYIEGYYDREKWGSDSDYNELMTNFELMKSHFVDKGIPIIIGETGVITEGDKDIQSVREYLYVLFSLSVEYNGIMACVWDTSNQTSYGINYYNRENDKWYDEKIKNNFIEISKGNFFKSSEFYIKTNIETSTEENFNKNYLIKLRMRKALKIFVNATFYGKLFKDFNIRIYSINKNNEYFEIYFNKNDLKKQYDGTTIIALDVSNKDCNEQIEVHIPFGRKYLSFNGLSIEFKENFISFDYKAYKSSILNNIS